MKRLVIIGSLILASQAANASQSFTPISTTGPLSGTALVTGLNANDDALKTSFSGPSSPSSPSTGQLWFDTSTSALKVYTGSSFSSIGSGGAGSGTVNSALANQIAYYASNGTAVGGLTSCNNGVIKTSSSAVPSCSTTLPTGLTIPGYLTGNQTITLSGDASGSGATSLAMTISANAVSFAKFQQLSANTVVGNGTGSTANATALAMPSCSASDSALTWTSATGFGCHSIAGGGGSGTVNSGTQYQLGYYGTTGTAISGHSAITTNASSDLLVSSGLIGVGTATPRAALDLGVKTSSLLLPVGTTGQRPASPVAGMTRYNSTLQRIEAYINNKWTTYQLGETMVDVTLPPYNAACDGTTNDTTAFTNAIASGYAVYIPPSANGCALNNLTLPSGTRLVGANAKPWYDTTSGSRSWVTSTSTTGATILNPNGSVGITIDRLDIAGKGLTWGSDILCIAGGSTTMYLRGSSVRFCGNGGVGTRYGAYTNGLFSEFSNYYANGHNADSGAINNIIDSQIIGGALTSNLYGVLLLSGADSNAFTGVRIEWNAADGIVCDGCHTNVMSAMTVDANEDGGIYLRNADTFQFSGYLWRNGVTGTSGKQSHVTDAGGNTSVTIDAVYKHGFDDGGGGTDRPKYVLEVTGTGSVSFNMSYQPMSLGYVTAPYLFTANPTRMNLDGNDTGKTVTISSCGTSPSVSGDDNAGVISVGSGTVTACTITFGNASWRNRRCQFNTGSNVTVYQTSVSSSAITVTTSASVGSGKLYYLCSP